MKVRKKKIGDKQYFYLEHSFREGAKVTKKEVYLGTKVPENIDELKTDLNYEIMKEQYLDRFESIKKNFSDEYKTMPTSAREKYLNYFMIKFTYDTNRIEGSTITLKETARILDRGVTPENKPVEDIKETETHKKVFYDMIYYQKGLSIPLILKWHRMLLSTTHPDIAGRIRTHQVKVAGSKAEFPFPAEISILLQEFIDWYHKNRGRTHPLELAAAAHLRFVSIHPFTDGNGRMSRLLMNFILNRNKYPMLNIKYANRESYYNALERSQTKKQERIFILHIFRRYLKEYGKYIRG
jgi:Fic family protein